MTSIDDLQPEQRAELLFHGDPELGNRPFRDVVTFLRMDGDGEQRRARFESTDEGRAYQWEAYRFDDHWAYGTGADKLTVTRVIEEA